MGLQKEVWAADIAEKLFPDNSFVNLAIDDSQYVENSVVNLANAGVLPAVKRNRTTLPSTVQKRDDVSINYNVDEFTSDPTLVQDIEEIEVNYNKRQSVLKGHTDQLNLQIANWMQYNWAPSASANIVRTTGSNRNALVTGATGTRKQLTLADVFSLAQIMDDMDIPEEGRVLLLPSFMYNDLLAAEKTSLVNLQVTGESLIQKGQLMSLLGFRIIKRGKLNVLSYTNAGTPVVRTPDASTLTSANAAALAWHPNFVRRALGGVKAYVNEDDATLYGSAFSTMARAGGRKAYSDETGVVAIVEAAGA